MNIIEILINRDGLSEQEAIQLVKECKEHLVAAGQFEDEEDIILEDLCLEPDYLPDIFSI